MIPQVVAQQDAVGPKQYLVRDQPGPFIRDVIREEVKSLMSLASSGSTVSGHGWPRVDPPGQGVSTGHHPQKPCVTDPLDHEIAWSRLSLHSEQEGLTSQGMHPREAGLRKRERVILV